MGKAKKDKARQRGFYDAYKRYCDNPRVWTRINALKTEYAGGNAKDAAFFYAPYVPLQMKMSRGSKQPPNTFNTRYGKVTINGET